MLAGLQNKHLLYSGCDPQLSHCKSLRGIIKLLLCVAYFYRCFMVAHKGQPFSAEETVLWIRNDGLLRFRPHFQSRITSPWSQCVCNITFLIFVVLIVRRKLSLILAWSHHVVHFKFQGP